MLTPIGVGTDRGVETVAVASAPVSLTGEKAREVVFASADMLALTTSPAVWLELVNETLLYVSSLLTNVKV